MRTRRRSKAARAWAFLATTAVIFAIAATAAVLWRAHTPPVFRDPEWLGRQQPVFYRGEQWDLPARGQGPALLLPLEELQRRLAPDIRYEAQDGTIVLTTAGKVVRMRTDRLTATVNERPFELRVAPIAVEGNIYIPAAPVAELYRLRIVESSDTGAVVLFRQGDVLQWGRVGGDDPVPGATRLLRWGPDAKQPAVQAVAEGEEVLLWGERAGWYRVQLQNGKTGYMRKSDVVLLRAETVDVAPEDPPYLPWRPVGGRVVMVWEHVTNRNPDPRSIGDMPALNVVSPTWFHLADGDGTFISRADPAYVDWAHSRGLQVWALASNSFDPDLTAAALATYDKRMRIIRQLLAFAQMYRLQGINLDFENVYLKDGPLFTQFVREFVPLAHEQGLTVSVDVTVKGGSETWSQFYDRPALARAADYLVVMAYDEHWASSPTAGSVSSLGWTEQKAIRQLLEEDRIPRSKLVLGIPFYTRIWEERLTADGKTELKSRAVGMQTVRDLIREKNLTPVFYQDAGQNYVEYREADTTYKIWIEDETSLRARLELVKKYDLAGIAAWRRGFETADVWPMIRDVLEKKP